MREDNVISERKGVSISLILTLGGLFMGLIVTSLTSIYALGSWSGIINTKLDLIPSAINSTTTRGPRLSTHEGRAWRVQFVAASKTRPASRGAKGNTINQRSPKKLG